MVTQSRWIWLVFASASGIQHSGCGNQLSESVDLSPTGQLTQQTVAQPTTVDPRSSATMVTSSSGEQTTRATTSATLDPTTAATANDTASERTTTVVFSSGEQTTSEKSSESSAQQDSGTESPANSTTSSSAGNETFSGSCTTSTPTAAAARGSGPHQVIVETNPEPGIDEGTIFRPADLGGSVKFPIFVWGQGGCAQDGLSNATAMTEIASHGYFVIADGTPGGMGNRTMDRSDLEAMGAPLMAYVDWAIAENEKPCSAYYQKLDPTKIAANGFSCGGLMAQGTVLDSRIVTWGVTSSGMAGATQSFYDEIDTPVLFVEGGPDDVAYAGGLEGYESIVELGVPVMWFDKALGHGGDLFQSDGGDFTKINLAWLNWWLKNDETTTGKGLLVGGACPYCSDAQWDVRSANLP